MFKAEGHKKEDHAYQLPHPSTLTWRSPEERDQAARLTGHVLAFLKGTAGSVPVVGWLASGSLEVLQQAASDSAQRQLQQRLEGLVAADQQLLRDVGQLQDDVKVLSALADVAASHLNDLQGWLEAQGQHVTAEAITKFALNAALAAYKARVALDYRYVDHRGVKGAGQAAHVTALPLDDIYVRPQLVPLRAQAEASEREHLLLRQLEDPDLPTEQRASLTEQYAALTGERWRTHEQGLAVGEALADVRQAVVLGSPGVGKSALIRYLARASALGKEQVQERLGWDEVLTPVVLPLAAFAVARADAPSLTVRAFLERSMSERGGEALRAAVAEELDGGRAMVLLDGVDEVPEPRLPVVRAVDQFLVENDRSRCIVTSRPHGYTRVAGEVPHFRLPNFSPDQIKAFVYNWQRAFERSRHPDVPDYEHAEAEASELLDELKRNERVAELAANPLMLVIISLIRYEQARLPQERVQLYDRAVATLMDTWNYGRSLVAQDVGGTTLPLDRLVRVWAKVAEWTRRTKPTGVIYRAELKRKLVEILCDEELDDEDPNATAESYLRAAAERAGLLEERIPGIFAFWHATFEEYLAAVELATPTSRVVRRLLPLRDDPRWREVVLLAVGYVGVTWHDQETATEVIEAIADEDPPPYEPILHPRLRLAAACIADDVGVKRTVAQQIVVRLGAVIHQQPYPILEAAFTEAIHGLPKLLPKPDTVTALSGLSTSRSWTVRMEVARWLANVSSTNPQAHAICAELLADRDPDVRCHAAFGLARAGDYSSDVCRALAHFTSDFAHMEATVRQFFASDPPEARKAFHEALVSDDPDLRLSTANLLRELEQVDEQVIAGLRSLFASDDLSVRLRAIEELQKLRQVDVQDEEVVRGLRSLSVSDAPRIRVRAAEKLFRLKQVDDQVVGSLRPLLTIHDMDVRIRALALFYALGQVDQQVADSLRSAMASDENNVPNFIYGVADLLWPAETQIDSFLASILSESHEPNVYTRMIEVLTELESEMLEAQVDTQAHREIITHATNILRSLLASDDVNVRLRAAQRLVRLVPLDEQATGALRSLLASDDVNVRLRAAQQLVGSVPANEQATGALRSLLASDDMNVRLSAAEILVGQGQLDEKVISALRSLLDSDNPDVRLRAVELLQDQIDEQVIRAFLSLLNHDEPYLRFRIERLKHELKPKLLDLEQILKILDPTPWAALEACRKVADQRPMSHSDGKALAAMVQHQDGDDLYRRQVRTWLFDWLTSELRADK